MLRLFSTELVSVLHDGVAPAVVQFVEHHGEAQKKIDALGEGPGKREPAPEAKTIEEDTRAAVARFKSATGKELDELARIAQGPRRVPGETDEVVRQGALREIRAWEDDGPSSDRCDDEPESER